MTLTLTEQEYTALTTEAAKSNKQPEALLHEIVLEHLQPSSPAKHPLTEREFMEQQYREGKILNIPTRRPLTPEEQAERERIGWLFSGGKPMSEMVIEDRVHIKGMLLPEERNQQCQAHSKASAY